MSLPAPVIRRRPIDAQLQQAALQAGFTPLQARLLGARLPSRYASTLRQHIAPSLAHLDPPDALPDIQIATQRIADIVMDPTAQLIVCSDHDVDGGLGNCLLRIALIDHFGMPAARVGSVLSHKRKEGFGISDKLLERMIVEFPPPATILTVDQSSQDEPRIATLKAMKYETIISDHHHVNEPPPSAIACVNPSRHDSLFADHRISGCHVAWLIACSVRRELIARGHLPSSAPSLACLLDLVAATTVVDASSIGHSANNRAVLRYGLHLMNRSPRVGWQALREVMNKEGAFDEQDLSFGIGPRINSLSRMGDALPIIEFMTTSDIDRAVELARFSDEKNQERKAAERVMVVEALAKAEPQVDAGCHGIVVYMPEGSSSIHGVVASRLSEKTGRPVMCLSPKFGEPGMLTGSLRTAAGVNILQALTRAQELDPECLKSFGGHPGAGGCQLRLDQVERLTTAFNAAVGEQRDLSTATPVVDTDGEIGEPVSLALLDAIRAVGPFGREFEAPAFETTARINAIKTMGDGSHLRCELGCDSGDVMTAVWFSAMTPGEPLPFAAGQHVHVVFTLSRNIYRGKQRVDVHVRRMVLSESMAA